MAGKAILATSPSSVATLIRTSSPLIFHKKYPCTGVKNSGRVVCGASAKLKHETKVEPIVERRSGNYMPNVWDYDLILSSTSDFQGEEQMKQVEHLKHEVKSLFSGEKNPLVKLELIDTVQKLGLEYIFEEEIGSTLNNLYQNVDDASWINEDLYTNALRFRLFRQKGFPVSEGAQNISNVFEKFQDTNGEFKSAFHGDFKTLLTLYDASFLAYEDEAIMDEARRYTTKQLTNLAQTSVLPEIWARKVAHALDVPLHWRINRLEARWFIDIYEQNQDMNHSLLQLAKLDYNILQFAHLQETKELIRWWLDMGLNKTSFSRDRILEHYLWCCSMLHEPQFGKYRKALTKVTCFLSLVDDVYDVYGSLEELELTTDFVDRWDMSRIDELPPPMRKIILAMFNTTNEIGYMSIKEQDFNTIPYISKVWADLCKIYFKEAKWYNEGCIPTVDQYKSSSVVTSTSPLMLMFTYILVSEKLTKEALDYIQDFPSIVHCTATIVRLTNDLATSKDELARGDNAKSIQCYMNAAGVTEEVAREHIKDIIERTWKIMNKSLTASYSFSNSTVFLRACQNLARIGQHFYRDGDGHGISPETGTKDRLMSLLVIPVQINEFA